MTSTTQDTTSHDARTTGVAGAAPAGATEDSIAVLRGQIDGLDEAIVRLVAERARLSARVQRTRISSGGTRVQLGRERVIRETYRAALGPNGPELAESVLQVCRGSR